MRELQYIVRPPIKMPHISSTPVLPITLRVFEAKITHFTPLKRYYSCVQKLLHTLAAFVYNHLKKKNLFFDFIDCVHFENIFLPYRSSIYLLFGIQSIVISKFDFKV